MKVDIDFTKPRVVKTVEDVRQLQKDCIKMVNWWIWTAREKFGLILPEPIVRFDLMGTTSGTAYVGSNLIRFSPILLRENPNDFLIQTTGHEVAHIVNHRLNKGRLEPHGNEWKHVMWRFGLRADVCHNYNIDNVPSMRGRRRSPSPKIPTVVNKDGSVSQFRRGVKITEL